MTADLGGGLVAVSDTAPGTGSVELSSSDSDIAVPASDFERGAFRPAGKVVNITVKGELKSPLTLHFDGKSATAPKSALPMVLRHDPQLGWYPIAVAAPGAIASAKREHFSPHVAGFLDVGAWWNSLVGGLANLAGVRTDPPTCNSAPPAWATVQPPALDVVQVCGTTNKGRVEVRLKNNRGVTEEVAIPPGVDYVWVDGQADWVRGFIRQQLGSGRDIVMLSPGQEMTVGFTRPQGRGMVPPARITVTPSNPALFVDLIERVVGRGNESAIVALVSLAGCTHPAHWFSDAPKSLDAVLRVLQAGIDCIVDAAADSNKAQALAEQVVALKHGVTQVEVKSDWQRFGPEVEQKAGALKLAGTALKVVELGKAAQAYWEVVAELAGQLTTDTPLTDVVVWRVPAGPAAPTVASLVIQPGRLGPLVVGMSGAQAVATGWVKRKLGVCDTRYEPVGVQGFTPEEPAFGIEFRDGSPEDLDGILVAHPGAHTPEGIRVGSSVALVRKTYGSALKRLDFDPQAGERLAVQGSEGWMIIGVEGLNSGNVTYFDLDGPTKPGQLPTGGYWEC